MNPLAYTQSVYSKPYNGILHLNQTHFLSIKIDVIYNSVDTLEGDPISFSEGRNCNRKVATLNKPNDLYTKCLFPTLQRDSSFKLSPFLTVRVDLNHNSIVSLQDDPTWLSEGRNCNRKEATLNEPIGLYTKCLFPTL